MQSFDTKTDVIVGRIDDLPTGTCVSFALPSGSELAVYNVDGEFYATENSCPHRGARLTEGALCGHVIECWLHGWQFDVRSGECLTVPDRIRTYRVRVENDLLILSVESVVN